MKSLAKLTFPNPFYNEAGGNTFEQNTQITCDFSYGVSVFPNSWYQPQSHIYKNSVSYTFHNNGDKSKLNCRPNIGPNAAPGHGRATQ